MPINTSSELLLRVMIREYLLRGVVDPQSTEKDFGHALMAKVRQSDNLTPSLNSSLSLTHSLNPNTSLCSLPLSPT